MKDTVKIRVISLVVIASWAILLYFSGENPLGYNSWFDDPKIWLLYVIPVFFGAPLLVISLVFSYFSSKKKNADEEIILDLSSKILKLAFEKDGILSIPDIIVNIKTNEENIRLKLVEFEQMNLAQRFINVNGQEMYRFHLNLTDNDKKDILETIK